MITSRQIFDAKLLVVDDTAANVNLLQEILRLSGYHNIRGLTDPREVLDLYKSWRPDLVLLDLRMPYLDGFQVMKQLQQVEKGSYIPVLALTAEPDYETRVKALEAGAKDFLTKPFDRIEILNRVRNLLEVRLLHNQARDQNEILEQMVIERTSEIHETRKAIIHKLSAAAEYKDNETGQHIIRMSKICHELAKTIGIDERSAEVLLNAAPMHDIGKIGVPDTILKKPGPLDSWEWRTMRSHTTIGAEILGDNGSELLVVAQRIALHHHEKWDGSGYPDGLAGTAIPYEARIAAVADVFDALTSKRPYKAAWSFDDAVAEIQRGSGTHFDPAVVDAFSSILPSIKTIHQTHADPA